jgi:hypothetical protein
VSVTVDTTAPSTDGFVGDITIHSRTRTPTTETRTDDTDPAVNRVQSVVDGDGSREFTAISTISGGTATFDAYGLELDAVADQNLTFDGLTVGTTGGPLVLSAAAVGPEAKHALAIEGVEPLGAVELRVESGRLADATLRFSVSERYFERRDVDPANLTVYRKSDGELSELPLRVTGKRDGRVTFEAETPGFSTFVVGVDEAGRTTRTAATGTPVTTDSGERQSTPDTEPPTATEPATPAPVEEPGGFGLSSLVGLLGLLAIIAAVFALARRVPRG